MVISHNGQEEDWLDRQLQTETLTTMMREATATQPQRPTVFLGYVVTKPGAGQYLYDLLTGHSGGMVDVDPTDTDRWCQYIFYRGLTRISYARVSHGRITDTEIQAAKFVVESRDEWKDNPQVSELSLPESHRFPALFKGAGVRGHRYHVFDEPKYYRI